MDSPCQNTPINMYNMTINDEDKNFIFFHKSLMIPKNFQYLVNGESDRKSVTSKNAANLNSRPNPPQGPYPTCRINLWQTIENFGSSLLLIDTNLSIMINPLALAINRLQEWIPHVKIPL